jgi:hypothetical protein
MYSRFRRGSLVKVTGFLLQKKNSFVYIFRRILRLYGILKGKEQPRALIFMNYEILSVWSRIYTDTGQENWVDEEAVVFPKKKIRSPRICSILQV